MAQNENFVSRVLKKQKRDTKVQKRIRQMTKKRLKNLLKEKTTVKLLRLFLYMGNL